MTPFWHEHVDVRRISADDDLHFEFPGLVLQPGDAVIVDIWHEPENVGAAYVVRRRWARLDHLWRRWKGWQPNVVMRDE